MRGQRSRRIIALTLIASMTWMALSCSSRSEEKPAVPAAGVNAGPDGRPAPFREPVRLSSKDGVLEVRLSAHQSTVNLDTVKQPVTNFMVFGYELIKGTSSDGSTKGDNTYPAPTLRVDPGERLIVHFDNDLQGLTIADFNDPAYTPTGGEVPLYPPALTSSPINLHTHGFHISPSGNADNVLLNIPAGMGNTYDYPLPKNLPQGLYWYHSHRHMLTAQHTYHGLAGLLEIGRPDGGLPVVTKNNIPIRDMALQYNFVFDRRGGSHQLNNPYWEQWVNTLKPPEGTQLADGTYPTNLAPVNFSETSKGAQFVTNWYAGPLSPNNKRGGNQFIPTNLQNFTSPSTNVPADPTLPDNQRDVQFTVNGQFQPELKMKPGQTEIWALANISDIAYMSVRLTETATGNHPKFSIVGQDGNPYTNVMQPVVGDGSSLFIPPASRFAIAVTMPKSGDLVMEMPPMEGGKARTSTGVLYTNNGAKNPPAVLGDISIDPKFISYADGFFAYPTQVLMRATPDNSGEGQTTAFEPGMPLFAHTSFRDDSVLTPDVTRELTISGGFGNSYASKSDPRAFNYQFDNNMFPNIPLIQPRLNTMEEWKITNFNNDGHPMHIHVNDFQVTQVVDPTMNTTRGPEMFSVDNANVPPPVVDANDTALAPASLSLRTEFEEFIGTYVIHCHRLNHEDNGLMATINVIPNVSTYAVAVPGSKGKPATVRVFDANGDKAVAAVTPFPAFEGTPSVAMADVDGDGILDLIVGTGAGASPEVVAYSGAYSPTRPFNTELARFAPLDPNFKGGVNVAAANIDGNPGADNIIVGTGPGTESQVKVFSSKLPEVGKAPEEFASFKPYPGSQSGVTVATGLVSYEQGRPSIITAPGPGEPARVKVFHYDLFTPTSRAVANGTPAKEGPGDPTEVSEYLAYDQTYTGGISLATGWVAGEEGGAQSIITGQLTDAGTVRVWSSGSRLDGAPVMYTHNPDMQGGHVMFRQTASFEPFTGASPAVTVATTSTTQGADLLVSGIGPGGNEVRKYDLARSAPDANTLAPKMIVTLPAIPGVSGAAALAGR